MQEELTRRVAGAVLIGAAGLMGTAGGLAALSSIQTMTMLSYMSADPADRAAAGLASPGIFFLPTLDPLGGTGAPPSAGGNQTTQRRLLSFNMSADDPEAVMVLLWPPSTAISCKYAYRYMLISMGLLCLLILPVAVFLVPMEPVAPTMVPFSSPPRRVRPAFDMDSLCLQLKYFAQVRVVKLGGSQLWRVTCISAAGEGRHRDGSHADYIEVVNDEVREAGQVWRKDVRSAMAHASPIVVAWLESIFAAHGAVMVEPVDMMRQLTETTPQKQAPRERAASLQPEGAAVHNATTETRMAQRKEKEAVWARIKASNSLAESQAELERKCVPQAGQDTAGSSNGGGQGAGAGLPERVSDDHYNTQRVVGLPGKKSSSVLSLEQGHGNSEGKEHAQEQDDEKEKGRNPHQERSVPWYANRALMFTFLIVLTASYQGICQLTTYATVVSWNQAYYIDALLASTTFLCIAVGFPACCLKVAQDVRKNDTVKECRNYEKNGCWMLHRTETGDFFFFNRRMMLSQWAMPAGFEYRDGMTGLPWLNRHGLDPILGQFSCTTKWRHYYVVFAFLATLLSANIIWVYIPLSGAVELPGNVLLAIIKVAEAAVFYQLFPFADASRSQRDLDNKANCLRLSCLAIGAVLFAMAPSCGSSCTAGASNVMSLGVLAPAMIIVADQLGWFGIPEADHDYRYIEEQEAWLPAESSGSSEVTLAVEMVTMGDPLHQALEKSDIEAPVARSIDHLYVLPQKTAPGVERFKLKIPDFRCIFAPAHADRNPLDPTDDAKWTT